MGETYCGKNCGDCSYRSESDCSGCKSGPGSRWHGECELADCCRDKGHVDCSTCTNQNSCSIFRSRDNMPEKRRMKREAQAREREEIIGRSHFLGKWLWILFWLLIPGLIAGVMTNETVVSLWPLLYLPGRILDVFSNLAYGIILLIMAAECYSYRTAGICTFIGLGCLIVSDLISAAGSAAGANPLSVLFAVLGAIIGLIGDYDEYKGHETVLYNVDNELSDKWMALWKWYLIALALLLGSIILVLFSAFLGILAALAGAIAALVVSIMKWVYLYRTAAVFRDLDRG